MTGYLCLHLHSHMPYVRKNGVFPVGEDWLYQVISDTYLPLYDFLSRLSDRGVTNCLSLTLTPVLCEQLADTYVKTRFLEYLETMKARSLSDREDFIYFADEKRKEIAERYYHDFDWKRRLFQSIDGDLVGAYRELEEKDVIEILSSSATHAFLQGFNNPETLNSQIMTGLQAHRQHFGHHPHGFWLPECAYRKGIEKILQSEGIEYVILDSTSISPKSTHFAYLIGDSKVAAVARNELAHRLVWNEKSGYPSSDNYLDSTKYYHSSGLRYWRVTGQQVPIEEKDIYNPEIALKDIDFHASDFLAQLTIEMQRISGIRETPSIEERWQNQSDSPPRRQSVEKYHFPPVVNDDYRGVPSKEPLVLAAYDTELFGHGWREGILWIHSLFRLAEKYPEIRFATPYHYLEVNQPSEAIQPIETTWGTNRDSSTWINESTSWMWDEINTARKRLQGILRFEKRSEEGVESRFLKQAARELLLLESSDWPYMVAKNRAKEYATQRFRSHLQRFNLLIKSLEGGLADNAAEKLGDIEETDKIFMWAGLDLLNGESPRSKGGLTCGY